MFDEIPQPGPTVTERLRALFARSIQARFGRIGLGALCLLLGVGSSGAAGGVWAMRPAPCMELRQAQFTLDELIETKDKVLAYEEEPEGELVLSGKEASFVLADNLKFPVWIETRSDELFVQAAIPDHDLCFNVEFLGRVEVEAGLAHVVPTAVKVGSLDVSPLVAGTARDIMPGDIDSADASRLLSQTMRLRVVDDRIHVVVEDPRSLR